MLFRSREGNGRCRAWTDANETCRRFPWACYNLRCLFFCGFFYWGKKSLRIAGLCFLVGLSLPFLRDPLWDDGFNGRYVKVEGRVKRIFQKGENQKLLLQGEKMNGAAVREKFYIRGVTTEYVPGEKISVEGFFRSPRAQKNPYLFDEKNYIRSLGAAGSIQAENISSLECVHWKLKGHLYVLSRLREFSLWLPVLWWAQGRKT